MPGNVLDWWIALPTDQHHRHYTQWWASLTPQRQAEASAIPIGEDMPRWMWRTLIPPRRRSPTYAHASTGQLAITLPTELHTAIHTTAP